MVCGMLNSPPKNIKVIFFQFVYITDPSGIYLGTKNRDRVSWFTK